MRVCVCVDVTRLLSELLVRWLSPAPLTISKEDASAATITAPREPNHVMRCTIPFVVVDAALRIASTIVVVVVVVVVVNAFPTAAPPPLLPAPAPLPLLVSPGKGPVNACQSSGEHRMYPANSRRLTTREAEVASAEPNRPTPTP